MRAAMPLGDESEGDDDTYMYLPFHKPRHHCTLRYLQQTRPNHQDRVTVWHVAACPEMSTSVSARTQQAEE